jgi:hypothetical protein
MLIKTELKMSNMTMNAESLLKVLPPPEFSLMEVLIRESVQNSIDASDPASVEPVRVDFDLVNFASSKELSKSVASVLRKGTRDPVVSRLLSRIESSDPTILTIRDSGTTGLSGPTRMDDPEYFNPESRNNFDNLVCQIGRNHGAQGAGGSFGFGKTVFYRLSDVGLVLFYSRCEEGERLAFFMVSVDEMNSIPSSTGLCWWGGQYKYEKMTHPCPIEDRGEIASVLEGLNLQSKRFKKGETGTLIAIVSPQLSNLAGDLNLGEGLEEEKDADELRKQTLDAAKRAALKWYWPRMLETKQVKVGGKRRPLHFSVHNELAELPPGMDSLGKQLMLAAETVNLGREVPKYLQHINYRRIKLDRRGGYHLGTLAFVVLPKNPNNQLLPSNTVAMLRSPRMIVYHQSVSSRSSDVVIGIFLLNSEVRVQPNKDENAEDDLEFLDNVFKKCESATHSEWNYQTLPSNESWFKTYVKYTKDNVKNEILNFFHSNEKAEEGIEQSRAAKTLGTILGVMGGLKKDLGLVPPTPPERGSPKLKKPRLRILKQTFEKDHGILLHVRVDNLKPGEYSIPLEVSNKSASYDAERWHEELHGDFPLEIIGVPEAPKDKVQVLAKKHHLELRASEGVPTTEQISIRIRARKRDVLWQLGITKNS